MRGERTHGWAGRPGRRRLPSATLRRGRTGHPDGRSRAAPSIRKVGGLPAQPTRLIDREQERADALALFEDGARLVTFVGPGGAGKTRLGVAVAEAMGPSLAGGAFFVDLAHVVDPARVLTRIADALGLRDLPGEATFDLLTAAIGEQRLLLLLDNLEQVLAAAPDVARLLTACPGLLVLATSRQPLRLRWERVLRVPPLAVPDGAGAATPEQLVGYPAVALFFERARALDPALALTAETAGAAAEICRRLDGLPLAIEIAAARADVLPPPAILRRVGDALEIGADGPADLPERQRSLRSTVAWSYDLLAPDDQRLFRRLAVFPAGCTAPTAAEVLLPSEAPEEPSPQPSPRGRGGEGDLLPHLAALADRSLLVRTAEPDGEPRFRMLDTIRAYAAERLAESRESAEVAARRTAAMVRLAEAAPAALAGPDQVAWLDRLDREDANLQAALHDARDRGEIATALRIACGLARFWELRGRLREGRGLISDLLADARSTLDEPQRLRALLAAAHLAFLETDYADARALHDEALAAARALDDVRAQAAALNGLGLVAACTNELVEATRRFGEALRLNRRLDDRAALATNLNNLGRVAHYLGQNEQAVSFQTDSLSLRREIGDAWGQAIALSDQADAVLGTGDAERALALQRESLALWRALGSTWGVAYVLEGLLGVELARGRPVDAVRSAAAAAALRERIGEPASPVRAAEVASHLAQARRQLAPAAFESAWSEGRTLDPTAPDEAATPPPAPTPPALPSDAPLDPLSAREREVAVLVARGLTNRQVAEELIISERTVDVHVARILNKLGFATRSQVAAWIASRSAGPG